ncbi:riboflavin kinase, partial [Amycolatopsis lexingtonensis]|uniref:riboflavin kinase n=1 Tax=Amycolatopsis lexingtonensis TaxID=218822 RepID=UPI003B84578D
MVLFGQFLALQFRAVGGEPEPAAEGAQHRDVTGGLVVRGDGRGHELGYPTANLSTPRFAAVPADGVYSAWFTRSADPSRLLRAAVSVGTNPTFSGRERTVEA